MGAIKRHILIGVGAALLLLLIYVGIITWAQGIEHALVQAASLWYWVAALAGGFGLQAGLFSFIRQSLRERRAAATASVAASGGISAGSMVACCAHHLADVLPLLGLSGLATFLASYQVLFIIVGVLANAVGALASGLLYWRITKAMRQPVRDGFRSLIGTEVEVVSRLGQAEYAQYL